MVELIRDIDKLREFDEKLWQITKDLPIRTGSVFKVPSAAYHRWGIEKTAENEEWLKKESGKFYVKDTDELLIDPYRENMIKTPFRVWTESRMADEIGWIVREFMRSMDDGEREFSVCDIGARFGQTTTSIVTSLRDSDMDGALTRTKFYLIDRSAPKLEYARRELERYGAICSPKPDYDEDYLGEQPDGRFDIIVSLAHFHHKPFPDYFDEINRVLADDGVLVVGDWHSALWDHPINAAKLLERIGAGGQALDAFREHFGRELMLPDPDPKLDGEERQALEDHMACWIEIAANLNKISRTSRPRVYFLEAHETSKARTKKLEKAGFVVDMDEIRKAFPKSKLENIPRKVLRNSDFAVVMAAMKRRGA